MRFSELYKLYTLLESPNTIVDPKTGERVSYTDNAQSWSGYLLNPSVDGEYRGFILHSDIYRVAGHSYMNTIIKDGGDPEHEYHKWFKRLRTNLPEETMTDFFLHYPTVQFRLWLPQKIMSFWKPYNKKYIVGIEKVLTNMNQNAEEYTFEFNGATANQEKYDYECYDYPGLLSGKKLQTFDAKEAKRREEEWEEDKKLLSQIQMGMKPTLNNKPRSIFNQGEGD